MQAENRLLTITAKITETDKSTENELVNIIQSINGLRAGELLQVEIASNLIFKHHFLSLYNQIYFHFILLHYIVLFISNFKFSYWYFTIVYEWFINCANNWLFWCYLVWYYRLLWCITIYYIMLYHVILHDITIFCITSYYYRAYYYSWIYSIVITTTYCAQLLSKKKNLHFSHPSFKTIK